jgi:hypothetical protein
LRIILQRKGEKIMAIKIYREGSKELKTPMVKYDKDGIIFVNELGKLVARLLLYRDVSIARSCRQKLEQEGYRTDFAEWDSEGRLVRFLEEIV